MATRSQVLMKNSGVYLYQFLDGYNLATEVQESLKINSNWNYEHYLSRMIFDVMVKTGRYEGYDDTKESKYREQTLGFGIGTEQYDVAWLVIVDVEKQKIQIIHDTKTVFDNSFENFIKADVSEKSLVGEPEEIIKKDVEEKTPKSSPKVKYGKFELGTLYSVTPPIIVTPGAEKDVTDDMREKYKLEALLHIKEIFEKEQAPDYHILLWLSFASLTTAPSHLFGKIQMQLTKKFFSEKCDFVKEEKLEPYEQKELEKLGQWIFKKQIEHLKQKCKEDKI